MARPTIQVEHLAKKFRLGMVTATTLADDLARLLRKRPAKDAAIARDEFWALRDISFDVPAGEVVGIIGRNGAGKSTLLKILSRITEPTAGRAIMRGRVASLLEVGTGFHPDLTGRENVFLNGAILGMRRAEIAARFDEIVAFAEVEHFIDTPVKHYSSGMRVRLAFAVAAFLRAEVLIVDEVLAVGDAAFQKKCLGKMHEVSSADGRTVVFVSHNMGVVANLCRTAFWLKDGQLHRAGAAREIVQDYLASDAHLAANRIDLSAFPREGDHGGRIRMLDLERLGDQPLRHGEPARFRLRCDVSSACEGVSVGVGFSSLEGTRLLTYDSDLADGTRYTLQGGTRAAFELSIPELPLAPGIYLLDVGVRSGDLHGADYVGGAAQVEVTAGPRTPGFIVRQGAGVRLPSRCVFSAG